MTSIPLSEFEQSPALPFTELGQSHIGKITDIDKRAQTDPKTGKVKQFESGDNMMQYVITIRKNDGTTGCFYAKGGRFEIATGKGESMLNAIANAIKAAGASSLDVGGTLGVAFTGEGPKQPGMNPAKLYTAQYSAPPAVSVAADDLFTNQE
jgi:hypothetical protein